MLDALSLLGVLSALGMNIIEYNMIVDITEVRTHRYVKTRGRFAHVGHTRTLDRLIQRPGTRLIGSCGSRKMALK